MMMKPMENVSNMTQIGNETEPKPPAVELITVKCKECGCEWRYNVKTMPQLAFKKSSGSLYYILSGKPVYCLECNKTNCKFK